MNTVKRTAPWEVTRPSDRGDRQDSTVLLSPLRPQSSHTSCPTRVSWSSKATIDVVHTNALPLLGLSARRRQLIVVDAHRGSAAVFDEVLDLEAVAA